MEIVKVFLFCKYIYFCFLYFLCLPFLECLEFRCFLSWESWVLCCQVVLVSLRYTLLLSSCHFVVSDMFFLFPCIWSVSLDLHWSRWQMGRALFCALKSLPGGNRSSKVLFLVPGSSRAVRVVCFPCALSRDLSAPWLPRSPTHQSLNI